MNINGENTMTHPAHLDGSVDKGEVFIESGMTLITEVESERHFTRYNEQRKLKNQNKDFIERWGGPTEC